MKDPYIKKCILRAIPESSRPDVKAGTIFGVNMLAVRWLRISPDRGCNGGSVATLWHTSVKREAVMSRISLCLTVGKPPVWQIS